MLRWRSFHQRGDSDQIRCGPQPVEDGPGRTELQPRRLLVAKGAAGQADQHARAGGRIRRLDPLPHLKSMAQRTERGLRIAFGQRSEEHTSELQSLMRISYAVFCLKKKNIEKATVSTKIAITKDRRRPLN